MKTQLPIAETSFGEMIGILAPAFVVLSGVVGYLFKAYVEELKSQRDSWKKLAEGSVEVGEQVVNHQLIAKGLPVVAALAPVIAQHNSPTTAAQQNRADFATVQARHVATVLGAQRLDDATVPEEPKPVKVEIVPASEPLPVKIEAATHADPVKVEIVPAEDPLPVKVEGEKK